MAYEKHTWTSGEVITAEKLNNMEDGISSNSVLLIDESEETPTEGDVQLNTTFGEIYEAYIAGRPVIFDHTETSEEYQSMQVVVDVVISVTYMKEESERPYSGSVIMNNNTYVVVAATQEEMFSKYPYMTW